MRLERWAGLFRPWGEVYISAYKFFINYIQERKKRLVENKTNEMRTW